MFCCFVQDIYLLIIIISIFILKSPNQKVKDIDYRSEPPHEVLMVAASHARQWTVTFTGQPFDLPSMLVSTRAGPQRYSSADLVATAGTLGGTSPIVHVKTKQHGGLPLKYYALNTKSSVESSRDDGDDTTNAYYFVRVSCFNGVGWYFCVRFCLFVFVLN